MLLTKFEIGTDMSLIEIDLLNLDKAELIDWLKANNFYNNPYVVKLKEINDYSDFELDKILNVHYQLSLINFKNEIEISKDSNPNQILFKILSDKLKERVLFEKHRNSQYFSSLDRYNFFKN